MKIGHRLCRLRRCFFGVLLLAFIASLSTRCLAADEAAQADDDAVSQQVGDPRAPGMMVLLRNEIEAGLKQRRIEQNFARFQSFAARKLDSTARGHGGEVTGICRLGWYDHLLRNILDAPGEAEQFTRKLHTALIDNHEGLDRALAIAADKLDLTAADPASFAAVDSADDALAEIERVLLESQAAYADALAPLKPSEISQLVRNLYPSLTSQASNGHTLPSRGSARSCCRTLKKMDRQRLHDAAVALVPLVNPQLLDRLAEITAAEAVSVAGVSGTVARRIATSGGDILIGGSGPNTYQLDALADVSVVIDLGGNDTYQDGIVSLSRPVLILIDLAGNDVYRGTKPGVQGSAVMGVSMLVDRGGNDTYQAKDVAQGSALGGAGILVDFAGDDAYVGLRRVQGHALGGIGVLIDRDGNDRYHAAMWAQGFGNPLGFGVLDDLNGNDTYYCGGLYYDSYPETPGYDGWGQGVGAGLRQVANGGVGVILDGSGDDTYEFDYLAHGGGYWLGVGFARDFGGNDRRLGATRKMYNGSARRERSFQRFSNGYGCHYTLGFLFDDAGDDVYNGTIMGVGFAWDCAVGVLCDFAGNDRYEATGGGTQGNGAQAGLGVLFDYDGDDVYKGYGQGQASSSINYHDLPHCGGNFSFVVDYGGEDQYGCRARNNSYNRRGSSGGFLIDRPRNESGSTETVENTPSERLPGS